MIYLTRNDVLIDSLNGTPGQNMSYNDNVPLAGQYNYQVYCTNSHGASPPANASAWIGLDVPAAPTNVVATSPANLAYHLVWTAPTTGQHSGYWPPGSWTGQKIYANGNLVATLIGTNITYDGTVVSQGVYTFGVAYYNASGDGPTTNAAPLSVTGPTQYTMATTPYNWVEINPAHAGALAGTNSGLNSDDQNLGPFNIGFSFPSWSGTNFPSVHMCSNGFASFTSTAVDYNNLAIPSPTAPLNLLSVYWDDMNMTLGTSSYGTAWYYTNMPNNRFIMEWDSCAHYGSTGSYFTYEIILHTNGMIDFMYKALVPGTTTPFPQATVGIQDATGTLAMQATFNGSGPIEPQRHTGIRFAPTGGGPSPHVTLTPANPPIHVPANGGSFQFNAAVINTGTQGPFVVWGRIKNPDGTYTATNLGPVTITPPPNVNVNRNRTQNVPASWPAGNYLTLAYANATYTYPAMDSSSFGWDKLLVSNGGPMVWDATCGGELFDGEVLQQPVSTPAVFGVKGAFPNPFNPTTTISFTLPEASRVTLNVFDISGRLVTTLVNGLRAAGQHSVTFDGSNLSSGVYLYRLTAGAQTVSGKMVLMK